MRATTVCYALSRHQEHRKKDGCYSTFLFQIPCKKIKKLNKILVVYNNAGLHRKMNSQKCFPDELSWLNAEPQQALLT